MKRLFFPIVVATCFALISTSVAAADTFSLSRMGEVANVAADDGGAPDEDVVRLVVNSPDAAEQVADMSGVEVVLETRLFSTIEVPAGKVEEVRNAAYAAGASSVEEDGVSYLMQDADLYASPFKVIPTDPKYGLLKGLEQMNMPSAWRATKGSPDTVIAIIDTGVATVPELSGRVLAGYSVVPGEPARVPAADGKNDSHGTMAAVVAAGAMNNGVANVGSCPECTILPVRVFPQGSLSASNSAVAAGILWAADSNADIISMSLGGPTLSTAVADAIKYASSKGKLLIAAAGNSGGTVPKYPAALPEVLSVAGVNDAGSLYSWSDRGTTVDFAAHGCNWGQNDELVVEEFCGTSSAAPLFAGALALYHTQNPSRTATQIRSAANGVRTQVSGINGGYINAAELLGVGPITGSVTSLVPAGPGKVTVSGTVDVEDAQTPAELRIYLSGGATLATVSALGAFTETVNVSGGGTLTICVDASHPTVPSVKKLGCRSISLAGGNPVGNLDSVKQSGPGRVRVSGWVLDPDTVNPVDVHIYVDGKFTGSRKADASRPDVGKAYPGYGDNHGFVSDIAVSGGRRSVCVYGLNVAAGNTNTLLGCRTVNVSGGNPVGSLDLVTQFGPTQMRLSGWALDLDTVNPVDVHIYVDGKFAASRKADASRPDVGKAYPGYGDNHGFTLTLPAKVGARSVCVYAINTGAGNTNPLLGCRSVNIRSGSPIGDLNSIKKIDGVSATISGWALDFDTVNPVAVQIRINNRLVATIPANGSRPDVGKAHPGYGDNHGFTYRISAGAGAKVCVTVINSSAGGNTTLPCKRVP